MSRMSKRARQLRKRAIEKAITAIAGEDALEQEPDLVYSLDELLAQESDDAIEHLAKAAANAEYADKEVTDLRRADDRTVHDSTEAEKEVSYLEVGASDTLFAYVEQRVADRIEEAADWPSVSLDQLDLDLDREQEESR
jgi:hypothetical protein